MLGARGIGTPCGVCWRVVSLNGWMLFHGFDLCIADAASKRPVSERCRRESTPARVASEAKLQLVLLGLKLANGGKDFAGRIVGLVSIVVWLDSS
jgi:hypothetical protein